AVIEDSDGGIQTRLDDAAMAVMAINGGSAVPLWNTWLDGMQEGAPESEEMDVAGLKAMFARAFEELDDMSGAKVGDKTLMDALIPATEAIAAYEGEVEAELFAAAAAAAMEGAENSKNFASKFGRAKSYGAKTIGTPDAGAMSMAYFFKGLDK
ncbi:MAG: DAK2 domain-containing protein, partial [Firmicutes bacterium]|nr:DAK2 domain-containing protein [Bacillota bacterium]